MRKRVVYFFAANLLIVCSTNTTIIPMIEAAKDSMNLEFSSCQKPSSHSIEYRLNAINITNSAKKIL